MKVAPLCGRTNESGFARPIVLECPFKRGDLVRIIALPIYCYRQKAVFRKISLYPGKQKNIVRWKNVSDTGRIMEVVQSLNKKNIYLHLSIDNSFLIKLPLEYVEKI